MKIMIKDDNGDYGYDNGYDDHINDDSHMEY